LENELLLRFKETLSRNLRNEELISVANVKVLNK
jgi:hypothetical protein